jgi:Tfp pilus assembly protein PilF
MTTLLAAGEHDAAMTLFKEWLSVQLQRGHVPPIGKTFYDSLTANNYQQTMNDFLLSEANQLADSGLLMTLNSLAVQMRELGNTKVADQMMTKLLATLNTQERPDVSLHAIEQLRRMKDVRADKLLDQVMELPMAEQIPQLWRFASKLAEESGRKRLAAERLEHALQLEFATRPTTINIETVRRDYAELLAKYDELITAAATLEVAPPDGLSASIVQAADQWRTLDEDDTTACQTASRLLAKLNRTDLAWDYLVTPLAENSGESAPWIALARNLGNDQQIDLAEMAWSRAFEFESTNPEILLEHAILLQSAGRTAQAKAVLQRVATETWQPRFSATVQKIADLLQSM